MSAHGGASSPDPELLLDLMSRSSQGDEAAFSQLYDRLAGLVYGIAVKVVRDPAQAQEVTQEAFLEIWQHAPRFDRSKGSVRSWVAVIGHRRAVDRVRAEQARGDREEREQRLAPAPSGTTTDPVGDAVDRRSERDRVRRALATLTTVQRQAVELAYYQGYTYRQVAVALDTPEGTIKTRIRDGMIRLRDALGVVT